MYVGQRAVAEPIGATQHISVTIAKDVLKSVLGPTAEILFFACPNKSIQKKRHPDAALILRSAAFGGDRRKGLPAPLPITGFLID
jgi:hypothetical protein